MRTLIATIAATAILGLASYLVRAQSAPATAPTPPADMNALIDAVYNAKDEPAVLEAFKAAAAVDKSNLQLNQAFVLRMVELGLPDKASDQAVLVQSQLPTDGLATAVIAFNKAKTGDMAEAMAGVALAAKALPKDEFVVRTAAQLAAWYDQKPKDAQIPDFVANSFAETRKALAGQKIYDDAFAEAQTAYKELAAADAQNRQQAQTAQTPPPAKSAQLAPAPAANGANTYETPNPRNIPDPAPLANNGQTYSTEQPAGLPATQPGQAVYGTDMTYAPANPAPAQVIYETPGAVYVNDYDAVYDAYYQTYYVPQVYAPCVLVPVVPTVVYTAPPCYSLFSAGFFFGGCCRWGFGFGCGYAYGYYPADVIFIGRVWDHGCYVGHYRGHRGSIIIDHDRNIFVGHARSDFEGGHRRTVIEDAHRVTGDHGRLTVDDRPRRLVPDRGSVIDRTPRIDQITRLDTHDRTDRGNLANRPSANTGRPVALDARTTDPRGSGALADRRGSDVRQAPTIKPATETLRDRLNARPAAPAETLTARTDAPKVEAPKAPSLDDRNPTLTDRGGRGATLTDRTADTRRPTNILPTRDDQPAQVTPSRGARAVATPPDTTDLRQAAPARTTIVPPADNSTDTRSARGRARVDIPAWAKPENQPQPSNSDTPTASPRGSASTIQRPDVSPRPAVDATPRPETRTANPQPRMPIPDVTVIPPARTNPEPRGASPDVRTVAPAPRTVNPQASLLDARTTAPAPAPFSSSPQPQTIAGQPRMTIPDTRVIAPQPQPAVPEPRGASPEVRTAAPEMRVINPQPAAPEVRTAAPEARVAAPQPAPVMRMPEASPAPAPSSASDARGYSRGSVESSGAYGGRDSIMIDNGYSRGATTDNSSGRSAPSDSSGSSHRGR